MIDQRFRSTNHPKPLTKTTVAQLSIFTGGKRKGGIEPFDVSELLGGDGEVICGKKRGAIGVGVKILVEVVDEHLTRGRKKFSGWAFNVRPPMAQYGVVANRFARVLSQSDAGMQSSSVKAKKAPLASNAPAFRACAGPAWT